MRTKKAKESEAAGKRRAVIYLDHGIFRRVREEHVQRDMPVSHVVEDILARHYRREDQLVDA